MSHDRSTSLAGFVAILGLALAALACSAPGLTVPPPRGRGTRPSGRLNLPQPRRQKDSNAPGQL